MLERPPGSFGQVERAKRPERLPVVLTREEMRGSVVSPSG